jgi:NADPH:quinone reductase-like Zn-dependent oxidoreductase
MKAAVYHRGAVRITDVPQPTPAADEVLVCVHATTVCAADYRIAGIARSAIGGWIVRRVRKRPTVLGMELAGTVESAGKAASRFRAGDQVFGGTGFRFGAHAEHVCAQENRLETKPAGMTLEESAAVVFGGLSASCFVRWTKIQAGQNVLVYGASGSVGVFAVQLAKHFGARVTGVCSTPNAEMVKSLGAAESGYRDSAGGGVRSGCLTRRHRALPDSQ